MLQTDWADRSTSLDVAVWSAVLTAPFVGSFLGVLIRRLPAHRPIAWTRSHCERCGATLCLRDLVPILSWLLSRGRCRSCGQRLGWFYPAIELAALSVALLAVLLDDGAGVWLDCVLGWTLLALAWIDAEHWVLPDALTLPLILLGLGAALIFDPGETVDRALAAALGYLALRSLAYLYSRLRRRDGLGEGDAKLFAAAGAWVGVGGLPQVILIAALTALFAAGCLRLSGVRLGPFSALPFGPFLALATWLVWLMPIF